MTKEMAMGLERELGWVYTIPGMRNNDDSKFPAFVRDGYAQFNSTDGSRAYVDCGHYEVTTCECTDPWELVKHARAIDNRIFGPWAAGYFVKANSVGDLNSAESFGSHENYSCKNIYHLFPRDGRRENPAGLIALGNLLISRNYFSGEGGMDPGNKVPVISRRLCHTNNFCDNSTTGGQKPLINTKTESHGTSERLHVICGGDNMSDWSMLLKFGITSIGVRLVSLGHFPVTDGLFPSMHQDNMLLFPIGKHAWLLEQEKWYEKAVEHVADLPPWAAEFMVVWKSFIDMATASSMDLAKKIDWQIKYQLFRATLRSKDISSPETKHWKENFNLLESTSFLYGKMTPDGGYFKLKGKLDCTIQRCDHSAYHLEPIAGRARTRARIMRFLLSAKTQQGGDVAPNWDVLTGNLNSKQFKVHMPDPTSESCIVEYGSGTKVPAKNSVEAIDVIGRISRGEAVLPPRATINESSYRTVAAAVGVNVAPPSPEVARAQLPGLSEIRAPHPTIDIQQEVDRIIQQARTSMDRDISDGQRRMVREAIAAFAAETARRNERAVSPNGQT